MSHQLAVAYLSFSYKGFHLLKLFPPNQISKMKAPLFLGGVGAALHHNEAERTESYYKVMQPAKYLQL